MGHFRGLRFWTIQVSLQLVVMMSIEIEIRLLNDKVFNSCIMLRTWTWSRWRSLGVQGFRSCVGPMGEQCQRSESAQT